MSSPGLKLLAFLLVLPTSSGCVEPPADTKVAARWTAPRQTGGEAVEVQAGDNVLVTAVLKGEHQTVESDEILKTTFASCDRFEVGGKCTLPFSNGALVTIVEPCTDARPTPGTGVGIAQVVLKTQGQQSQALLRVAGVEVETQTEGLGPVVADIAARGSGGRTVLFVGRLRDVWQSRQGSEVTVGPMEFWQLVYAVGQSFMGDMDDETALAFAKMDGEFAACARDARSLFRNAWSFLQSRRMQDLTLGHHPDRFGRIVQVPTGFDQIHRLRGRGTATVLGVPQTVNGSCTVDVLTARHVWTVFKNDDLDVAPVYFRADVTKAAPDGDPREMNLDDKWFTITTLVGEAEDAEESNYHAGEILQGRYAKYGPAIVGAVKDVTGLREGSVPDGFIKVAATDAEQTLIETTFADFPKMWPDHAELESLTAYRKEWNGGDYQWLVGTCREGTHEWPCILYGVSASGVGEGGHPEPYGLGFLSRGDHGVSLPFLLHPEPPPAGARRWYSTYIVAGGWPYDMNDDLNDPGRTDWVQLRAERDGPCEDWGPPIETLHYETVKEIVGEETQSTVYAPHQDEKFDHLIANVVGIQDGSLSLRAHEDDGHMKPGASGGLWLVEEDDVWKALAVGYSASWPKTTLAVPMHHISFQ